MNQVLASAAQTPPNKSDIIKYARRYAEVYNARGSWLIRKVAQYQLLDTISARYQFSYDIDFSRLLSFRLEEQTGQVVIPIDTFPRQPFISVSLHGPWGAGTCLATRRENTRISCYILFGMLAAEGVSLKKIDQSEIDSVLNFLADVSNHSTLEMLKELVDAVNKANDQKITRASVKWHQWVKNESFRNFVIWLLNTYFLCVSIPANHKFARGVIKVSWTDVLFNSVERSLPEDGFCEKVGKRWRNLVYRFAILGITPPVIKLPELLESDISLHFKFEIPSGMRVEYVRPDINGMIIRKTGRTVSFYRPATADVSFANAKQTPLRLFLNVKRELFAIPALLASLISLFVVGVISWNYVHVSSSLVTCCSEGASDAVTIASLIPALFVSYVALNDEHESLSVALGIRRTLLIFDVLAAVLYALITSIWNHDGSTYSDHFQFVRFVLDAEWIFFLFFAFENLRIETWRHSCFRKYRTACLAVLFVVIIVAFATGSHFIRMSVLN